MRRLAHAIVLLLCAGVSASLSGQVGPGPIAPLGYQARFTYLEGRTHFNLYGGDRLAHIAVQMYAVARPGTTMAAARRFSRA